MMKKLSRLLFLLVPALFFMTSCEDELTYDGDMVQTPVVFALLDKADSLHYVKITHSFGGNNDATQVALIPDSSYYSDIDVKIEEWVPISSNNANMVKVRTWTLRDTILTGKDPGAFYSPDQKVYYFQTDAYKSTNIPADNDPDLTVALKQSATYKLIATVNGGEYTINSETKLVDPLTITAPNPLSSYTFVTSSPNGTIYQNALIKTSIGSLDNKAQIVDARLKVYFNEFFNGVPVEKSFTWKLGELNGDEITGATVSFNANGNVFYNLIKTNVTNDPSINKRQLTKMEITVTGGTEVLSKYILVSQPNSSLAQSKPSYTNVTCSDGRQAIGVFTSRNKLIQAKIANSTTRVIDDKSTKELCTGPITGALLFCSDNIQDINNGVSYICQ